MPKFVCKFCGMITDEPTIVPHPDKDVYYRELSKEYEAYWQDGKNFGTFYMVRLDEFERRLEGKYNHSITCPVCLNETRFWREEPFPVDQK